MTRASGSFESRNGQPWSRSLATANDRAKPSDIGAGVHDALVPPSQEAMRRAVESQICPWCGAGPYKVLAAHTNKAHGVDRLQLRELAGLGRDASVCLPEVSIRARESLTSREDWAETSRKGGAAAIAVGAHHKGSKARLEMLAKKNAQRDAEIIKRFDEGELFVDIAKATGSTTRAVKLVLTAQGKLGDGRARRSKITGLNETQRVALSKGKEVVLQKAREELLARYNRLGRGEQAMRRIAEEDGRSRKAVRESLINIGVKPAEVTKRRGY